MTDFPSNVSFGTVFGRFGIASLQEGDVDGRPDFLPLAGLTVTFTASVPFVLDRTASPDPVTIVMDPVVGTIDPDTGYLLGGDGVSGVKLIATDDTDLDPNGFTYEVTYGGAASADKLEPQTITVPAGVSRWITNITDAVASVGVSLTIAEAAQDAAATSAAQAATSASTLAALNPDVGLADAARIAAESAATAASSSKTAAQSSATAAAGSATAAADNAVTAASAAFAADVSADAAAVSAAEAAASAATGGGGGTTDVQIFYADGTWTKPAAGTLTSYYMVGGGGGGQAGSTGATGTDTNGGTGGGGGALSIGQVATASLGATEAVTVGQGGAGRPGVSTNSTAAPDGLAGTESSFAGFMAGGADAYDIGYGMYDGGMGGAGGATPGEQAENLSIPQGGNGGGAGGGINTANAAFGGGNAFGPADFWDSATRAGAAPGVAGDDGADRPVGTALGGGGGAGGGAGGTGPLTVGGKGGDGGLYGGGGGGGGAARNGQTSGAGGAGAPGICIVVTQ